jgi:hypothetical protein
VLITKVHFTIGSGSDLVDRLALETLDFMDSVVDFNFFAVFWVCDVDSTHMVEVFLLRFDYYYKLFEMIVYVYII